MLVRQTEEGNSCREPVVSCSTEGGSVAGAEAQEKEMIAQLLFCFHNKSHGSKRRVSQLVEVVGSAETAEAAQEAQAL